MFTFKYWKKVLQLVMWNDFPSFLLRNLYNFPFFTPGKHPYFEISEMTTHTTCTRNIWWTLDFANAFLSPGVNSRAELVPSARVYDRNGALRRWLGDSRISSIGRNKCMPFSNDQASIFSPLTFQRRATYWFF